MPFFSIIIPLFNKEKYIAAALKSICSQTFLDFEVIIVNDGSTDNGVENAKPFLSSKIKLIAHSTNQGLATTRNTGIKNASSPYITFLDADDLWLPTYLETIKNLIDTCADAKIFATNYNEVYPSRVTNPINNCAEIPPNYSGLVNYFKSNLKQPIYTAGSVCYHKSVFDEVGFYNCNIAFLEDFDFGIRANLKFKLAYTNSIQMLYFMTTDNQLTRTSILHKTVPDYDIYEKFCSQVPHLKQYLDFQRYVLAKHLKFDGDTDNYQKMVSKINFNNLNYKQVFLLKSPRIILKTLYLVKHFLLKKGLKIHSYS